MSIHFADLLFNNRNVLKPIAPKSVMATPLVPGITFTSRVATTDINSLTFQRRAEKKHIAK